MLIALAYFCLCLGVYVGQRHLLFRPAAEHSQQPSDWQLPYQTLWIPVGDARLHAWWVPAPTAGTTQLIPGEPSQTVASGTVLLYFVGVGRNMGDANYLARVQALHRLGFSVLVVDYRGYGLSTPQLPSEAQLYADAEAVWQYAVGTLDYPPEDIWIYGESMGGAISLELAIQHSDAQGVILQSTFTRMVEAIQSKPFYRLLPVDWLLTQRFDSLEKISQLRVPVLFLHGTEDSVVPVAHSHQLYAAAAEPKQQFLIPGADHVRIYVPEQSYLQAIARFVKATQAP